MDKPSAAAKGDSLRRRYREDFDEAKRAINDVSYFCKGTISRRMRKCGQPSCRCAKSEYRHGPYYEWTYKKSGKSVNRLLSEQEAKIYEAAAAENKRLKTLLSRMERISLLALSRQASQIARKGN
jgi:hypothetical protein